MLAPRETLVKTRKHCMNLSSAEKAVQSLDINGSIIDVSPAWLRLTGYRKEEVIGRHFIKFLHTESLLCVERHFPYLKDFGYVDNVQLKIRSKDNKALSVSLSGTSKYDEHGAFERTFCELTFNELLQDEFMESLDELLDDMDAYIERLTHLFKQKVQCFLLTF